MNSFTEPGGIMCLGGPIHRNKVRAGYDQVQWHNHVYMKMSITMSVSGTSVSHDFLVYMGTKEDYNDYNDYDDESD